MMKLLFITIAEKAIGFGHLSRCLSLAEHAGKKNILSQFLLFGDHEAELRIRQAGHACLLYPISAFTSQNLKTCLAKLGSFKTAILDISHPIVLQRKEELHASLKGIRDAVKTIMLIDSMGEQALTTQLADLPIDTVVVPYAGALAQQNVPWRCLAGPRYAILSSAYTDLGKRVLRQKAHQLLISCGGSDPQHLTLLALKGIETMVEVMDVRVIVGPLFDESLKIALKDAVVCSKHAVTLVNAPQELASHMAWCDVAIATSGLIKYELAATSTPAILLAIDEFHYRVNQPFNEIGSTIDLGVNATPECIGEQVSRLLENYNDRAAMAAAGYQAVDGQGAERLIAEVIH
jgi:UDP-2,4-diacetamido-2,4,6-trideoxy-beta-L-altropyranose hydrolase